MSIRRNFSAVLGAALLGLSAAGAQAADTGRAPVLIELFTSESCSSCPPAEAYLSTLARQPGILALSYHVDYWNDLGWVDRYSAPEFTRRQQDYARQRGFGVYTPQMVINGVADAAGSRGAEIKQALQASSSTLSLPVQLKREGDQAQIQIDPAGEPATGARLLLLSFDPQVTTPIRSGENRGRTVSSYNVVRSLRSIGDWNGGAVSRREPLSAADRGERLALLVQGRDGRVLGAAFSDP
jgi:hypothetical protein